MSGVFHPPPPPPTNRPPLVLEEDTLAGWKGGGGGLIFWKTPDTALYSTYESTLWLKQRDRKKWYPRPPLSENSTVNCSIKDSIMHLQESNGKMLLNGGFFIETKNTIGAVAILGNVKVNTNTSTSVLSRGSQRDVVYLCWPVQYSALVWAQMGGGGGLRGLSQRVLHCAHGALINFGDLTPYLTYDSLFHIEMSWRICAFRDQTRISEPPRLYMTIFLKKSVIWRDWDSNPVFFAAIFF
jgi:hypothetical protein